VLGSSPRNLDEVEEAKAELTGGAEGWQRRSGDEGDQWWRPKLVRGEVWRTEEQRWRQGWLQRRTARSGVPFIGARAAR
jgi:hypothetical protein